MLHRVAARVRDVEAVGRTLDAALDAGATGVDLVQLGIADPRDAETEARRLAVADAQARAATIAEAAGAVLGPILAIAEGVALAPPEPKRGGRAMAFAMAADAGDAGRGGQPRGQRRDRGGLGADPRLSFSAPDS